MSTLNELKDWIEKGGKAWHPDWNPDEWMLKNDCGSFVDQDGMNVCLDAGLVLSDLWEKVASCFGEDKEYVINECFRYLAQYSEEDFKKMTMEIKETEEE